MFGIHLLMIVLEIRNERVLVKTSVVGVWGGCQKFTIIS